MPMTTDSSSIVDRPLYSPHKALDAVLQLGAIPQRLYSILYPIWSVRIEGRQRIATDFEELEWFLERALYEVGLRSAGELSSFFGLEERFVRKLVGFLRSIGHVAGSDSHLTLTELGRTSVLDRVRYQEEGTSAVVYFDGFGNRPLTADHYKVPVYDDLSRIRTYQPFYHFDHRWDETALPRLMALPDRHRYNLPDEITQATLLSQEPVYLPAYIVERRAGAPATLPLFLVFSRVKGMRDAVLEEAINVESTALAPLRHIRRGNLEWAVEKDLNRRGLDRNAWYLHPNGPWGPQITVEIRALEPSGSRSDESSEPSLTIRDVGGYLLVYNWCVWVTCDDARVRRQAAIERLLEWLQHVTATPTAEELRRRLAAMHERLRIKPISPGVLMDEAQQQGLARALERLEMLVTDEEWT